MFLIGSLDKSFLIEDVPGETGVLGGTAADGLEVEAETGTEVGTVGADANVDVADAGAGIVTGAGVVAAGAVAPAVAEGAVRLLSLGFLPGFGLGGKTQCLLVLITSPLREPP